MSFWSWVRASENVGSPRRRSGRSGRRRGPARRWWLPSGSSFRAVGEGIDFYPLAGHFDARRSAIVRASGTTSRRNSRPGVDGPIPVGSGAALSGNRSADPVRGASRIHRRLTSLLVPVALLGCGLATPSAALAAGSGGAGVGPSASGPSGGAAVTGTAPRSSPAHSDSHKTAKPKPRAKPKPKPKAKPSRNRSPSRSRSPPRQRPPRPAPSRAARRPRGSPGRRSSPTPTASPARRTCTAATARRRSTARASPATCSPTSATTSTARPTNR